MSNFLKYIQEESFYNDLLKKAKRICLSKHLVGQWDLDVYEAGDLVALVYERMIESYKKNSVKYNNLNKSELFSWFMTTLRGISIDQVRKLYSKKITTDKVYKSEKKNDIFKDEVKAETKKRVEWMELDNEFKTGIKNKKIPILGTNIQEDIYERNLTLVNSLSNSKLSKKCKEILEFYKEQYSMKEISEKTKLPINSVKSRLSNCRQELVDISGV